MSRRRMICWCESRSCSGRTRRGCGSSLCRLSVASSGCGSIFHAAMGMWPELSIEAWRDTHVTLLLYTQIVGKIRLALTAKTNEWWNVPLYVTTRGLTTSPMPYRDRTLSIDFDFIDHQLLIRDSDGRTRALALVPRAVGQFYRALF